MPKAWPFTSGRLFQLTGLPSPPMAHCTPGFLPSNSLSLNWPRSALPSSFIDRRSQIVRREASASLRYGIADDGYLHLTLFTIVHMDLGDSDDDRWASAFNSPYTGSDTDSEIFTMDASKKRPTLLVDLPENIKKRILEYVGLLRPCLINISFEQVRSKLDRGLCSRPIEQRAPRGGWAASWTSFYEGPCDHPRLPIEVFQSCQAFRRDAGALFFAQNRFSMLLYSKSDFMTFRSSMEWGMQHMRYLHLDLGPRDNRFLKLAPGVHRTILNMWVDFCSLSRTQMPSLRYFSMKCKVRDLEVACRLMCTMDPFPALFHCAFHLGHTQDDDIRPVIKRAAWRLTDNLPNKPPFPFTHLPKEIQLMVLEEILLNRSDPTLQPSDCAPGIITFQDRKRSRIAMFHSLTCCGTCSPIGAMCFCHARQTAFSTSCTCFSSPLPYFLVSREFYENSRRIFFTKNKFAFVDEDPDFMMRFLHYIPTASTLLIQHLSFKFPVCYRSAPRTGPRSEDATMLSWSVLRRFIREHFDLSRLSVKIVDLGLKGAVVYSLENRKKYLRKLLLAFTDLEGLRDFRVYLADDHVFEREAETAVLGPIRVERKRPGVPFISRQYLRSVSA
ncbi:hypothetical protein ASPCADRAFT_133233 [Aspergillus carbonarius ITEM 5010]|uniref:F-box domain-containing protein n=1 Tax=Aspergillus carbonarius (strain ITEM 5010) TaxID=602072 RepID=A0A1R3REC3_ASPC5|nr:hypothetical protein ASPCADRAFT_133233 [Aspergillus carbonarius ITEM 5010]